MHLRTWHIVCFYKEVNYTMQPQLSSEDEFKLTKTNKQVNKTSKFWNMVQISEKEKEKTKTKTKNSSFGKFAAPLKNV